MRIILTACLALLIANGCGGDPRPPVEISDVRIYAPLPGSNMSVAYLTIANNSKEPLVIAEVSSPQFQTVEIHATSMTNDVARMRQLDALTIPPAQATELREGAEHLMLMGPVGEPVLGDPITLFIRDIAGGEVVVRSNLESRIKLDGQ